MRPNGRGLSELRPLVFERGYTSNAAGSVLVRSGKTWVLCTCSIEPAVPEFLEGTGKGWLTAEYAMLPGSTGKRKPRDKAGKVDGRSVEIQRLIGRSLRAIIDLDRLGERTLWIDCDVLQADGGTRTAAINGAFVALVDGLATVERNLPVPPRELIRSGVAAISVGIVDGEERLDLEYVEDRDAEVDMNLVMTSAGEFIEVQGSGEEATFRQDQLDRLLALGKRGIADIVAAQKKCLGDRWPGK
jgi:ribonuclease PH